MSDSKQQLIARWDTFLAKIKERSNEIFVQANQGTDFFIPQLKFDTNALGNAWTGIKSQIFELSNKIEDSWEKMDNLFDEAGAKREDTEIERKKKDKLSSEIHWEYEKAYITAMAKAARHILANTKAHIDETKIHRCTQCGSPFNISIYSVRAINIKCESCSSVNSYKPDDRIVALETWVLVPLANENALTEKETEYFLDKALVAQRLNITNEQLQAMIMAKKATIGKYYQFLINTNPEKAEFYERQRDERLKWAENERY